MRFQVPQFIDVEDKIFGPLTLKQFIYIAGAASITVVAVMFLGVFLGLLVVAPIISLAIGLAFFKVNNRPLIHTIEAAFKYLLKDKLYIWKKTESNKELASNSVLRDQKYSSLVVPNLSKSKLKDMNWELDVKKKEEESS